MQTDNEHEATKIKITIKSQARSEEFNLDSEQTVKDIKPEIAERFDAEPENVCLIFAGRFLKDNQSLTAQNVKNGFVLHLVIRTKNNSPQSTNLPPRETRIMNENTLADLTAHILSNPQYIQLLINADPQMRSLMDQNPEVAHIINNPNLMREYLEMTTNPNMMREFVRNQDLTLQNIENMPGGFAALQRMYTNLEDTSPNPDNLLPNNSTSNPQPPNSTGINSQPLPNPWANTSNNNNTNPTPRPELMSQMLDNPQIQELVRSLSQDPEFIQTVLARQAPTLNNPEFRNFFENNLQSFVQSLSQNSQNEPPETAYREQLEQLNLMGFSNREANLNALIRSMGDINSAIDFLTQNFN